MNKKSLLGVFRNNSDDDDDYEDYEDDDVTESDNSKYSRKNNDDDDDDYEEKKPSKFGSSKSFTKNFTKKGSSVNMNSNSMEVKVFNPTTYEESKHIIDTLLEGNSAIFNLEAIDQSLAREIFDMITGATYALNGHMEAISKLVWLVTPNAINVTNDAPMTDDAAFNTEDYLV